MFASFFFTARGIATQKAPLGMYRALLHQILQQVPNLLKAFSLLYRRRCEVQGQVGVDWNWREADLQEFFQDRLVQPGTTIPVRIYIDALDECGEDAAKRVVRFFETLGMKLTSNGVPFGICFSCRHYPIVALVHGLEICVEDENEDDVQKFITSTVARSIVDSGTAAHVKHEVLIKSGRNFLWVVLVVAQVVAMSRSGKGLKAITAYIKKIPPELKQLYEQLFADIDAESLRESLQTLRWICFARRPLTVEELRFAAIIDVDTQYESLRECQDAEDFAEDDKQMELRIKAYSRGLAEVRTRSDGARMVQFIHQSVNDFVYDSGLQILDGSLRGSAPGYANTRLCAACLRAIAMDEVKQYAKRSYKPLLLTLGQFFPFIKYAVSSWKFHAKHIEKEHYPGSDVLKFFSPWRSELFCLWTHLAAGEPLHRYPPPWMTSTCEPYKGTTLLHLAASNELKTIVQSLILRDDVGSKEVNCTDDRGLTPLALAAMKGDSTIISILLSRQDIQVNCKDIFGQAPLHHAASGCHEAAMTFLLRRKDIIADIRDAVGRTPLSRAAEQGSETVARLLLERTDVDVDSRDNDGRSPFVWAVDHGNQAVVRLLLENSKVNVNLRTREGHSPLSLAVRGEREMIVLLLLQQEGIDMSSRDSTGRTPLSWAASNGNQQILEILLQRKEIDINSQDSKGWTALFWAILNEYLPILQHLLQRKDVIVNSQDLRGKTPLTLAIETRNHKALRCLLQRSDIKLDSRDSTGRDPLSYAVHLGWGEAVELLKLQLNPIEALLQKRNSVGLDDDVLSHR